MVQLMLQGELTVGEIAQACDIPSHMASEHLRMMQHCGLLARRQEGRRIYYQVCRADRGAADGLYRTTIWGRREQREGVYAMTIERGLRLAAGVVVLLSVGFGLLRSSRLAAVDGLRGREPAAIGLHELVSDGLGPGPIRTAALRGGASLRRSAASRREAPVRPNALSWRYARQSI